MSYDLKETIFKGWSVLLTAVNVVAVISGFISDGLGFSTLITAMVLVIVAIMAYSGLTGDYERCRNIAVPVVILCVIFALLGGFEAKLVLITLFAAGYMFMSVSLAKYWSR